MKLAGRWRNSHLYPQISAPDARSSQEIIEPIDGFSLAVIDVFAESDRLQYVWPEQSSVLRNWAWSVAMSRC
jgi:hypothetical protein